MNHIRTHCKHVVTMKYQYKKRAFTFVMNKFISASEFGLWTGRTALWNVYFYHTTVSVKNLFSVCYTEKITGKTY